MSFLKVHPVYEHTRDTIHLDIELSHSLGIPYIGNVLPNIYL